MLKCGGDFGRRLQVGGLKVFGLSAIGCRRSAKIPQAQRNHSQSVNGLNGDGCTQIAYDQYLISNHCPLREVHIPDPCSWSASSIILSCPKII